MLHSARWGSPGSPGRLCPPARATQAYPPPNHAPPARRNATMPPCRKTSTSTSPFVTRCLTAKRLAVEVRNSTWRGCLQAVLLLLQALLVTPTLFGAQRCPNGQTTPPTTPTATRQPSCESNPAVPFEEFAPAPTCSDAGPTGLAAERFRATHRTARPVLRAPADDGTRTSIFTLPRRITVRFWNSLRSRRENSRHTSSSTTHFEVLSWTSSGRTTDPTPRSS